ncbi:MAG: hypothetical protein FP831_14660 [Anaerolineae bacterium]|nr:hypothetical protein [Anaerolineae bacterium]
MPKKRTNIINCNSASQEEWEILADCLSPGKDVPTIDITKIHIINKDSGDIEVKYSTTFQDLDHAVTDLETLIEACRTMKSQLADTEEKMKISAIRGINEMLLGQITGFRELIKERLVETDLEPDRGFLDACKKYDIDLSVYSALRAQYEALLPVFYDELQEKKNAEVERKKVLEQDKVKWVKEHGSDHLKRCVLSGYDCQRLYVTERASFEHPGFIVDFDKKSDWRSRSCPSPEAMDIAETAGEGSKVVWLTAHPDDSEAIVEDASSEEGFNEQDKAFQACEAVVIPDYLTRYILVKYVSA